MFGEKNLLDDLRKKLLIRDLKLFSNGMNCFLCTGLKKREGLELFMERQLWSVVGASDSCICPDCSDLLSLTTGIGSQE